MYSIRLNSFEVQAILPNRLHFFIM